MEALQEAIKQIKTAGFSHLKVELEARMNRSLYWRCDSCKGKGAGRCLSCEGSGAVLSARKPKDGLESYGECKDCHGEGKGACRACQGVGMFGNLGNNLDAHKFILDYISRKLYDRSFLEQCKVRGVNPNNGDQGNNQSVFRAIPWIVYGKFYPDGSVGSEYTFTVRIEDADKVIHVVEAFKALGGYSGHAMDVGGAGMHMAVLPEGCGGVYPCPGRVTLDYKKLNNFKTEVTKLLPALFFLGTANKVTRGLNFRSPQISTTKYSAIAIHSALEFRVFDTCYDKPEAIYDFIEVIANCLKFYADPTLKVKPLNKVFGFTGDRSISNYFDAEEELRILNATVKYLKPRDKSIKQLRKERGVAHTITSLRKREKIRLSQLKGEYEQYKKTWESNYNRPLTVYEEQWVIRECATQGMSEFAAEKKLRDGRSGKMLTLQEYGQKMLKKKYFEREVRV